MLEWATINYEITKHETKQQKPYQLYYNSIRKTKKRTDQTLHR